ncbi:MAG: hypothetical protein H5U20_01665 [Rhodobacteraceae bacterium]|nr:hypothetical protein [Paracoccaceae bacterium]
MIVVAGLIGGGALGALRARQRGGNTLDMLQYAAAHAAIFGVLGVIATVVLARVG